MYPLSPRRSCRSFRTFATSLGTVFILEQTSEKGGRADNYTLGKLHAAGLKDAKLEPSKVNSPFLETYEDGRR
jgi:hypothetical protein